MSIRNASRKLAMLAASAVMVGTVAGLSVGTESSFALANGSQVPQSAVPIGAASNGAFASGQSIEVKVPANADLVPGTKVNILECADPSGTVSNLPTNIGDCDGNTIQGGTASVAANGSVVYNGYVVYALPDGPSLQESGTTPVCDLSNECVLYIGENQNDFTQAHVFSQAFYVAPNGTDSGTPAGNGASQIITFTSTANPAVVGNTYAVTASGGGSHNPVVFSLDGSSAGCSLSGATVHFTGAGTCTIDANEAGNGSFATAAQVSQSETTVSGFFVTTSSLSGATRGVPYSATLHACCGATPYKWKKLSALPKGLKVLSNGVISGTPKTKHVSAGNYTIKVQVQSHKTKTTPKLTATRSFTLHLS